MEGLGDSSSIESNSLHLWNPRKVKKTPCWYGLPQCGLWGSLHRTGCRGTASFSVPEYLAGLATDIGSQVRVVVPIPRQISHLAGRGTSQLSPR